MSSLVSKLDVVNAHVDLLFSLAAAMLSHRRH